MTFAQAPTNKKNNTIQTKLSIGQPGDKYEQEADAMADQVMRIPQSEANIQRKCTDCEEEQMQMKPLRDSISSMVQKQEGNEEETLQMKSTTGASVASAGMTNQLQQTKGSGSALPDATNQFMSKAFGTDFSQVNIHTGRDAVQMNRSLGARAFTHGKDVYFNQGEYNPESNSGKHLLAHELTHVVQQNGNALVQQKVQDNSDPVYNTEQTKSLLAFALSFAQLTLADRTIKKERRAQIQSLHYTLTYVYEQLVQSGSEPLQLGFDLTPSKHEIHAGDASKSIKQLFQPFSIDTIISQAAPKEEPLLQTKLLNGQISKVNQGRVQRVCGTGICIAIALLGGLLLSGCTKKSKTKKPNIKKQGQQLIKDLQTVIDGAIWKEIRKRVYPKESAAGIKRGKKRKKKKLPELTGLGKIKNLESFAKKMRTLQKDWPKYTWVERLQKLVESLNSEMVNVGVPGMLSVVPAPKIEIKGAFNPEKWQFIIGKPNFELVSLDDKLAVEITNTAVHEARHAEQRFLALRYAAGILKQSKDDIAKEQSVPGVILTQAIASKMDATTDKTVLGLGKNMYQAMVTDGTKNQTISNDDGWKEMADKRKVATAALAKLKATINQANILEAQKQKDILSDQVKEVERRYTLYRNIPYEADAHEVGDMAGLAFNKWR